MCADDRRKKPAGLCGVAVAAVLFIDSVPDLASVIQAICIADPQVDLTDAAAVAADIKRISRDPFLFRYGRLFGNSIFLSRRQSYQISTKSLKMTGSEL